MEEGILGVEELAGDRVVELRVVELRVVGLITCEWESDVVAVVAPLGGVAQVVSHGVKVVGVHGEEGKEKDEEVRVEVKGEVEENQGQPHMDNMWMKVNRLKDDLSQCGCDVSVRSTNTKQRASVLSPTCCACWCTPCHCCHCPHWS